ncbi:MULTISPECIES: hypothetical protein [unclassified Streptomyces]|uniref:hypothetical protein n=1 Tax=unclassified Streptomyces TaxID=2593676 RepID=UPI001EF204F6|nr:MULTISPECIES: hypothetical protein [unclassified Streptomyces]
MGRRTARSAPLSGAYSADSGWTSARDRFWAGELRSAAGCACALFAVLTLADAWKGQLTAPRAGIWAALAVLLFAVLAPARVSVDQEWLVSRGLLRRRRVRTDHLASVRWHQGTAPRLVLRDTLGGVVELNARVLVDNPLLWIALDAGVRNSLATGTLQSGAGDLLRAAEQIDGAAARATFRASGLE